MYWALVHLLSWSNLNVIDPTVKRSFYVSPSSECCRKHMHTFRAGYGPGIRREYKLSRSLMSSSCTSLSVWICTRVPVNTHLWRRWILLFIRDDECREMIWCLSKTILIWYCLLSWDCISVRICQPLSSSASLFLVLIQSASFFWMYHWQLVGINSGS